jgi:hypothetical protein
MRDRTLDIEVLYKTGDVLLGRRGSKFYICKPSLDGEMEMEEESDFVRALIRYQRVAHPERLFDPRELGGIDLGLDVDPGPVKHPAPPPSLLPDYLGVRCFYKDISDSENREEVWIVLAGSGPETFRMELWKDLVSPGRRGGLTSETFKNPDRNQCLQTCIERGEFLKSHGWREDLQIVLDFPGW